MEKCYYFKFMDTKKDSFGNRLASIRKARGLSQRDFGKLVGMSNRMVAYYEAQSGRPPATKLEIFAKVLKISIDELLGTKVLDITEPVNSRFWKRLQIVNKLPLKDQKKVVEYAETLAKANGLL